MSAGPGPIANERRLAIRRRAMKRWLRANHVAIPPRDRYSESALRKLIRRELDGGEVKELH